MQTRANSMCMPVSWLPGLCQCPGRSSAPHAYGGTTTCAPCHDYMRLLLGHDVLQARLLSGACVSSHGHDRIAAPAVPSTPQEPATAGSCCSTCLVLAFKGTYALW